MLLPVLFVVSYELFPYTLDFTWHGASLHRIFRQLCQRKFTQVRKVVIVSGLHAVKMLIGQFLLFNWLKTF